MKKSLCESDDFIIDGNSEAPARRSRTALYSDDLRLCLIEEIYKKPLIWNPDSKETGSSVMRRRTFSDIASKLQSKDSTINGTDVERQWKNLKDTYAKVKRKKALPEKGSSSVPGSYWRFFRCMMFIDPEARQLSEFDLTKEIAEMRRLHDVKDVVSTVENVTYKQERMHGIASRKSYESKLIRSSRKTSTTDPNVSTNSKQPTNVKDSTVTEDEYATFCNSLVHPLRDIGSRNKVEYFKFQKLIRDAIFDVQMRLHSSTR